jgi:hypothetical protein
MPSSNFDTSDGENDGSIDTCTGPSPLRVSPLGCIVARYDMLSAYAPLFNPLEHRATDRVVVVVVCASLFVL